MSGPFTVRELDKSSSVGRRFYVLDVYAGRSVGKMYGARWLAQREADRRNALWQAFHGCAETPAASPTAPI